jgi:hypothetical protein
MNEVLMRINASDACSPIAVFIVNGHFKAVPSRTIVTQDWIQNKKHYHVGTFHKDTPSWIIQNKFREAK